MKKLTKFDLGVIIAFVVIGLAGGGAYWWLSGNLATAQGDVTSAYNTFNKFSTSASAGQKILVSTSNKSVLQGNIDTMKGELTPLIQGRLVSKDNKLASIGKEDPVAWKHDLDEEVKRLTAVALHHNVKIPPAFYFAFSRYVRDNPDDDQTQVLSKQLLTVEQITNILAAASVKSITTIRRTYEEDALNAPPNPNPIFTDAGEPDHLTGYSFLVGNGIYRDYPYEIEFDTNPENLRKVLDGFMDSPYIFVLRSLDVKNLKPDPVPVSNLDAIAGTPPAPSVIDTAPGQVAATAVASTAPPQYIFGNSTLHVTARVDLIEWLATTPESN